MAPATLTLFFSYAHGDEGFRAELAKHLKLLERQGVLKSWSDRVLTAGSEWRGQIDAQLDAADIVLLLVSPDFIASDYCYDVELAHALRRHNTGGCVVVPVFLREIDFSGAPFSELQGLPTDAQPVAKWADRDAAFADVARGIRKLARTIASAADVEPISTAPAGVTDGTARKRDLERIKLYRDLFDRFAFSVPCIFEGAVESVDAACNQILSAMLTGQVVILGYGDQTSTIVVAPMRDFETEPFTSTMRQLKHYVGDLRRTIDRLRYHLNRPDAQAPRPEYPSPSNLLHTEPSQGADKVFSMEFLLLDLIGLGVSQDFVRAAIAIMDRIDSERNAITELINSLLSLAELTPLLRITMSSDLLELSAHMRENDWEHHYLRTHHALREFLGGGEQEPCEPAS
jgi:hypothetical protein